MDGMPLQLISIDSVIAAAKDQVSSDLDEEKVILSLDKGAYYSLDAVGASIWELIQEPRLVCEVRDAVMEKYDVGQDECERRLLHFLSEMAAENLIEVRDRVTP